MSFYTVAPLISFLLLLTIITVRVIRLIHIGVPVISKRKKYEAGSFILYPVFLFFMLLWIFELTKPVFQISFSVLPEFLIEPFYKYYTLKITGVIIILLALILLVVTLFHLKTSLRFGLNENNHGKLITSGVFSISRNPFFLSIDLYFFGIVLIFPSLFFIGFACLAVISIHLFILKEEKFLLKVYGKEYEEYKKKVHRYLSLRTN